MDILQQHEIFEIEVLDRMKSARLLAPLVFGGGTMLRLCHELPRYSADLDFWFTKKVCQEDYFSKAQKCFEEYFEITDAKVKHFTLLFELRSPDYPKRLKIEIRREVAAFDFEETIAFSGFATKQVALRAHTMNQTMKNKIKAFLSRGEIRDCFDIEFLMRRGIGLPVESNNEAASIVKKIEHFKEVDFKVKLGSILAPEFREYYASRRFSYLEEKLRFKASEL